MKSLISIGDLIDRSWYHYKASFVSIMSISGWLVILALLNTVALLFYPSAGSIAYHPSLTNSEIGAVIVYGITNILIAPLLGFWVFVTLVIYLQSLINNTPISIKEIYAQTKKRFWSTLVVTILVALTLILAQIITFGPSIVVGTIGYWTKNAWILGFANMLLVIGMIASLIITSRWTLYYVMAPLSSAINGLKNKQALKHSRQLIEGRFWPVLFRLVLPKIVFFLFFLVISVAINFMIISAVSGSTGLNVDVQQRVISLIDGVLPVLVTIVLNPLILLSDVLLFNNLQEQAE